MTLPSGGNLPPISLSDLNTEFGYGYNLAAYQGKVIGTPGGNVKSISAGAVIKISDFYSTNKVVGGSATLSSTQTYTLPQYKAIRITATAGGGGGAGGKGSTDGICTNVNGGGGSAGGNTSFGAIVSAQGGGGGNGDGSAGTTYTGNLANTNNGTGGNVYGGGQTGGNGGSGAKNQTSFLNNPVLSGGTGPSSASSVTATVGGAGGGGNGGLGQKYNSSLFVCQASGFNGTNGSAGGAGSIFVEWTGEP